MKLTLTTSEIDVATVARTVAAVTGRRSSLDPRGKLQLAATVDGNAAHPRFDLELKGHSLEVAGRALGELSVVLRGDDDWPLALSVHATPKGVPPAELEATSPLSLRTLLRRPPSAATLARTPFEINGHVAKVPLTMLVKLVGNTIGLPVFSGGTLSLGGGTHASVDSSCLAEVCAASGEANAKTHISPRKGNVWTRRMKRE